MVLQLFDTNGDGAIDANEAAALIGQADTDGDGAASLDELRALFAQVNAQKQAQHLMQREDANGDGVLDTQTEVQPPLTRADADGDGVITLTELEDFLLAQAQQQQANQQLMAQIAQDFQAADADGNHALDGSEWPAGASAGHADVDANGDGQVRMQEVGHYLHQNGASPF